ncbi:uncharacterized protein [Rutidosis leptorrhynchoides]|uniref:uncharacterized protein n=1 Tax=Rutidosis leptorrhynchoides TaxID=125765 RepID=UPI003A9A5DCA
MMRNGLWEWNWARDIGTTNHDIMLELTSYIGEVSFQNRKVHGSGASEMTVFSSKFTGSHINEVILPISDKVMRWLKLIPRKVNIFIWKLSWDRGSILSRRGMEIQRIGRLLCDRWVEPIDHVLFSCSIASALWLIVQIWLNLHFPVFDSWFSCMVWFDAPHLPLKSKDVIYVIPAAFL